MRLVFATFFAVVLLLTACGDDDSGPSPTPTLNPAISPGQQTPNPDACTPDELTGDLVSSQHLSDATILTLQVSNTQRACVFDGPPELRWYAADGTPLGVLYTPAEACEPGATEYDGCVYDGQVSLPEPDSNDANSVRAIVSLTDVDALIPCASPTKQASIVGLQFPGVSLDVQVPLDAPVDIQFCSAQVDLSGYGPVSEG